MVQQADIREAPTSQVTASQQEEADTETLAAAAAKGGGDALALLYDRYHEPVYRYCYSKLRDRQAAEDAASDVWVTVLNRVSAYEFFPGSHGWVGWLFTIARSRVIDSTRSRSRRCELSVGFTADMLAWSDVAEVSLSGPEDAAVAADTAQKVTELVQSLPANQANVLTCRFFLGLSIAETADVLRISTSLVKVSQHRGINALRNAHLPDARNLLGY